MGRSLTVIGLGLNRIIFLLFEISNKKNWAELLKQTDLVNANWTSLCGQKNKREKGTSGVMEDDEGFFPQRRVIYQKSSFPLIM